MTFPPGGGPTRSGRFCGTRTGTPLAGTAIVGCAVYEPRAVEGAVLHRLVREHLETFLRDAAERTDGSGLPHFVEREFRQFLTRGVVAHASRSTAAGCRSRHSRPVRPSMP